MKNGIKNDRGPIYKKIVTMVCQKIRDGEWLPGHKLPTVREMAGESGISCGTVKHAYDELELMGVIKMTQGRGTFVTEDVDTGSQSRKEMAMTAIEGLLNELEKLAFSPWDIRIFLDLKLRERDEMYQNVRVGVVDCNPETLAIIDSQLSELPNVDIYKFLLDDVIAEPYRLDDNLDLILTTSTHLADVQAVTAARSKLMFMVLSPSQNTVMDLAKVDQDMKMGILCTSRKFAEIIWNGCQRFCTLSSPPEIFLMGDAAATEAFAAGRDVLIVPTGYLQFCGQKEVQVLTLFAEKGKKIISYDYHIDKGSFFYLRERIEQIYKTNRSNYAT